MIAVGSLPKIARAREPMEKGAIQRWRWEKLHKVYKRVDIKNVTIRYKSINRHTSCAVKGTTTNAKMNRLSKKT